MCVRVRLCVRVCVCVCVCGVVEPVGGEAAHHRKCAGILSLHLSGESPAKTWGLPTIPFFQINIWPLLHLTGGEMEEEDCVLMKTSNK